MTTMDRHLSGGHAFEATACKLPGKIQWTVIYVPPSVQAAFGSSNRVNVQGTLGGQEFRGVLLPSKLGHYLVLNENLRRATGVQLGDSLHVELEADTEVRKVEAPDCLRQALAERPKALEAFERLPAYQQREEAAKVASAKQAVTQERRIAALLGRLEA